MDVSIYTRKRNNIKYTGKLKQNVRDLSCFAIGEIQVYNPYERPFDNSLSNI